MKYIFILTLLLLHVFILTFSLLISDNASRAEQISTVNKPLPVPRSYDPPIKNFEEAKTRIDELYYVMSKQVSGSRGAILIYGTKKEIALREAQIKRFIRLRKYNLSRFKFFRVNSIPGIKWHFVFIPSEANYLMETIPQCLNPKIDEPGMYIPVFYNCLNNRSVTK